MLSPWQVLQLILHPDEEVRYAAINYFEKIQDLPSETAAVFWQAIDQFGHLPGDYGYPQRVTMLRVLRQVPQDEASIERTVQLLSEKNLDENSISHSRQILERLPLEQIITRESQIMQSLNHAGASNVKRRFQLRSMSIDQLWDLLLDAEKKSEAAASSDEVYQLGSQEIIDALKFHPDVAERATEALSSFENRYWMSVWCAELLGALKYSPAIPLLIEALKEDTGDFLHAAAGEMLAKFDSAAVVPGLRTFWETQTAPVGSTDDEESSYFRMRVYETLGRLKDPLAESTLIELLSRENDSTAIASACNELIGLFTTDGIELIRQIVIEERYDPSLSDIREELVALTRALGYDLPELKEWEKVVREQKAERRKRQQIFKKLMTSGFRSKGLSRSAQEPAYADDGDYGDVTTPIRRESPKIGRNDPCPCGSGKKYKKCCGA